MAYIIPTIPPANVLRGHKPLTDVIRSDLARAKRVAEEGFVCREQFVIPHPSSPLGVDGSVRLALNWLNHWLNTKTRVAADVETSSLDFFNCKLYSIAISGEDGNDTAIAFTLGDLHTLPWPAEQALVQCLFQVLKNCPLIFHNAPFDSAVLRFKGYQLNNEIDDTMALHHVVQPDSVHTLDWVGQTYLDVPPWKMDHKGNKNAFTQDVAKLLIYNARDAIITQKLRKHLYADIEDRGMSTELIHWQNEFAKLATDMEMVGLPVNMEKRKKMGDELLAGIQSQLQAMREYLQWPDFNPMNKNHAITALYDKRYVGLMPTAWTEKSQQPSTKAEHLTEFMEHPFVRLFITYAENHHVYAAQYRDAPQADGDPKAGCYFRAIRSDGRLHPQWNPVGQKGTRQSSKPNCFDAATEVLTDRGWMPWPEAIAVKPKLMQYDANLGSAQLVEPTCWITQRIGKDQVVRVTNKHIDLRVTKDHRLLIEYAKYADYEKVRMQKTIEASTLLESCPTDAKMLDRACSYIASDEYAPTRPLTTAWIIVLCAAQADGWYRKYGNSTAWSFYFKKARKIKRLCDALTSIGAAADWYSKPLLRKKNTAIYLKECLLKDWLDALLRPQKEFGNWLLSWSAEDLQFFVKEVTQWDGRHNRNSEYASVLKNNVDWVQVSAVLSNSNVGSIREFWGNKSKKPCYRMNKGCSTPVKGFSRKQVSQELSTQEELFYCANVPSSYLFVRRSGNVVISGNCQNQRVKDRAFFEAGPGRVLVGADKDQLELRLIACLAGVPELVEIMADPNGDPHTVASSFVYGEDFLRADKEHRKQLRDGVKTTVYSGLYRAGARKIWQSIRRKKFLPPSLRARLTEQEVRKIIKAYFGRYPEIPAWHDTNYDQASTLGYVQTIPLGRRRWFPIAPPPYTEIANWPIQTAGSDIVTMEMIQIQYELKRRFRDAWIILHAHDALAIECYESDAEEVAALVNLLFGNTRIEGPAGVVILTAKAKIGKSLKDIK